MNLPRIIYRSERVGKNGKLFSLYKFRTMKEGFVGSYATDDCYTRFGKFLRKTKLDELPQIINVLKGDLAIVGVRPEPLESIRLLPNDIRKILLSKKPGLTSLSSVQFADEEAILKQGSNNAKDYFTKIRPLKLALDFFYIEHKCFVLDLAIIYLTIKTIVHAFFTKSNNPQ